MNSGCHGDWKENWSPQVKYLDSFWLYPWIAYGAFLGASVFYSDKFESIIWYILIYVFLPPLWGGSH